MNYTEYKPEIYRDRVNDWVVPLLCDMVLIHVKDFLGGGKHKKEAEDWIFGNENKYRIKFSDVCHILGYDPAAVRQRIKKLKASGKTFGEITDGLDLW